MPEIIKLECEYMLIMDSLERAGFSFEGPASYLAAEERQSKRRWWLHVDGENYPVAFMMAEGRKLLLVNGDIGDISIYHDKIRQVLEDASLVALH